MNNNEIDTLETFLNDDVINNQLTVSNSATVQPVALMRLGIFVPKPAREKGYLSPTIDASSAFSKLELSKAEGFDEIMIVGPRLDMEIDFKVWIGIIHAFSKYGLTTNTIQLGYIEFAKMCGFSPERFGTKLKKDIRDSIFRISNKGVRFTRKNSSNRFYSTSLLHSGDFDFDLDTVKLQADSKLWELYKFDYQVLLQLEIIKRLSKKETAQAIYTFIEALPPNPRPLSFARLRERLLLKSEIKGQNRAIKNAINTLIQFGYLDASIVKKDDENYLIIHSRNPKLLTKD